MSDFDHDFYDQQARTTDSFDGAKKDENVQPPIEVPSNALSEETLRALIESFILREGTDYGREEVEHGVKIRQILKQIDTGTVKIIFDPDSESVNLMTEAEWKKFSAQF